MKNWLFALSLILLLGIGAFFRFSKKPFNEQTVILNDGSVMQFFRTDYGTNATWTEASIWERLKMKLPPRFRGFQTLDALEINSSTPCLVLWDRWSSNLPGSQTPRFSLEDENGVCSSVSNIPSNDRNSMGGTNSFGGFYFNAFPRRGKTFTVHLFQYDSNWQETNIASFRLENPAWGKTFAEFRPEPIPATKTDGDLQVTLSRLVAKASTDDLEEISRPSNKFESGTYISLKMLQNNRPATNWTLYGVTFSDATGNIQGNNWRRSSRKNDELVSIVSSHLWPDEPAWKLKLELSRESGFGPEELVSFTNLVMSKNAWTTNVAQRGTIPGYRIEMLEPTSNGTEQPEGRSRNYSIRFKITPILKDSRFTVVNATDNDGHSLQCTGWGGSGDACSISLRATNRANALNLTLAIHKSRFVEFVAKPEVLKKEPARSDAR